MITDIKIRNINFNVDVAKNKLTWDHINSNLWENDTFDILDYFVEPNNKIIDMGCWSGVISLYLAKKCKIIFAIDPDPVSIKEIQKNITLNKGFENKIIVSQKAISNKKGTIHLSARKEYGLSSSSILKRRRDLEHSHEIKTATLLEFIDENNINSIDFIKIDVEGAEFLILPNINIALKKLNFPTLYISFHYDYLNENIYYEKIPFLILNKMLLKIESLLNINFFKKNILKKINVLWDGLEDYKHIYTTNKKEITIDFLKKNPKLIKTNNLVFTNKDWH